MRRGGLILALLAAASARAGLNNPVLNGPGSVAAGQVFTLELQVDNNSAVPVQGVTVAMSYSASLGVTPLATPPSAPVDVAPLGSARFTWLYSMVGCGNQAFTATAQGSEGGATVSAAAGRVVTIYCSPTPTPSFTPTPWIVYGTPTPLPREGRASISGNLYRPLLGQPLQLKVVLPEASTLHIDLYDRLGRRVRHFEQEAPAGELSVPFDGRGDDGVLLATGIYAAHFSARGLNRVLKFAILK
jgi:hypothetical protein